MDCALGCAMVTLTRAAQALAQQYELDVGQLPPQVQQALDKPEPGKLLGLNDVHQLFLACVPDRAEQLNKFCSHAGRIECPNDAATAVNILEARVSSLDIHVQAPYSPPAPVKVDPYDVIFEVGAKTAFIAFFNGQNVDASGRPAIMGIATREGHDPKKLDASDVYAPTGTVIQSQVFPKGAKFAKFHEDNLPEFAKGSPIIAVALDAKGNFLKSETKTRPLNIAVYDTYPGKAENGKWVADTSKPVLQHTVQTGEQLDTTKVRRYDDKLALEVKARPGYSPANWTQEPIVAGDFTASLLAKRGLIFEPGAQADVSFNGKKLTLKVEGQDAEVMSLPVRLPGSKSQAIDVSPANGSNVTVGSYYGQSVGIYTRSHPQANDVDSGTISFYKLAMPYMVNGSGATFAGQKMFTGDLGVDPSNSAGAKLDLKRRPGPKVESGSKDQLIEVKLEKGFVTIPDQDLKGFQVEFGFSQPDPANPAKSIWSPVERLKLGAGSESQPMGVMMPLEKADDFEKNKGRLEVRLYNAGGVPVMRMVAPVNQQLQWASDIFN